MEKGVLKELYVKAQKPVAYILLLIAIIVLYTPYQQLLLPSIAALSLLILNMLFTIEDKVSEDFKPKTFLDFYNATLPMQQALDAHVKSRCLTVKWIGTSMDCGWPFLRKNIARILDQFPASKVSLEIFMLSEHFQLLAELNRMWPTQVKNNKEDIIGWKAMIEEAYPGRIEVALCEYQSIPNYSGMLVNESTLFLAFCSWGPTSFSVGNNPYTRYEKKRGQGLELIDQYLKWTDYYRKHAEVQ